MKSGSGIDPDGRIPQPVHGQHEPREDSPSGAAGGAAVSSPPLLSPPAELLRHNAVREQAVGGGGGTHGSTSAAAGVDRKGKGPLAIPSLARSPPRGAGGSPSSSNSSDSALGAGRSDLDCKKVFDDLVRNQRAINKAHLQFEEEEADERQAISALWRKFRSYFARKLKIVDREEWIHPEHVGRQTLPITELRQYYRVADDMAILVNPDAYSRFRPVLGDGECFYRSFIFSYLEQVLDRQDTHEEHRLLDTVKGVSTQHTNLGWASDFSRSYKAFKKLIKKVMGWKRQGRWNSRASTNSYREEKLLEFFSNYKTTADILVFLRLVVAIYICSHGDQYEQLIPGLNIGYTLKDWCFGNVIPPRTFTDHLMMAALGTALAVPLRVEQLSGGGGAQDICIGPGVVSVTLLYTGNHYDILYPRAPPASSSSQQASSKSEHPTD